MLFRSISDIEQQCDSCKGLRYATELVPVTINDLNIFELFQFSIDQLADIFTNDPSLIQKLETLTALGLGHLRLNQAGKTLSDGEKQRIKLANEINNDTHKSVLYILDEPSKGLHQRDLIPLIELICSLPKKGHTVILIDHNECMLAIANNHLKLGPGSGEKGGEIINY